MRDQLSAILLKSALLLFIAISSCMFLIIFASLIFLRLVFERLFKAKIHYYTITLLFLIVKIS